MFYWMLQCFNVFSLIFLTTIIERASDIWYSFFLFCFCSLEYKVSSVWPHFHSENIINNPRKINYQKENCRLSWKMKKICLKNWHHLKTWKKFADSRMLNLLENQDVSLNYHTESSKRKKLKKTPRKSFLSIFNKNNSKFI